ncbi:MAG: hypothetical protein AAF653_14880 [Chloroflexota bacterium]
MEVDFTFEDIMAQLSLTSDPGLPFNILIYLCLFLNLIAFFMQDDKDLPSTLILGGTMALLLIAKLNIVDPTDLPALLINVGIFVFPIIVTGMSKAKKSKPLTGLAGLLGGIYFFGFWAFLQRGG